MLPEQVVVSKKKVISFLLSTIMLVATNISKFKWLSLRNTALFISFVIMKRALRAGLKVLVGQIWAVVWRPLIDYEFC